MDNAQWTPREISYFLTRMQDNMRSNAEMMRQCKLKNPADQMALHAHANELEGAAGIALAWAKEIEVMDSKDTDTEADNRQQHEENQWESRTGK